ncbi:MAG TPA: HD domain-containing protein [Gemmatimonadaceae bacterium]|nr:HD domain-containing protein [Gemmatimonadaceae bacterium]
MDSIDLPSWARVSEKRRGHIARVTALLDRWAGELHVPPDEARAWHDAGLFHDALRDAPEDELRALVGDASLPAQILHGPAAAARLLRDGETREDLLEAVRWHTVGNGAWARTGRALYMADFLEPGRSFARADRAFLASHLVHDFDGVFRQVVRQRLEWSLREGNQLYPETVSLWNDVA